MQAEKKGEWLVLTSPSSWEGQAVEEVVKGQIGVPKKLLHELRMNKGILMNGQSSSWQQTIKMRDRLYIQCFKEEEYGVLPQDLQINVVYEDDHLLIVNKPPHMDTHPNEKDQLDTLANGVAYHWQLLGLQTKVRHVHRLDRDTSGVILFAKHSLASALLDQALEKREITRTYVAIVEGVLKKKKGTINESIGKDRHHPTRRRVSPTGQQAVTHYEVQSTNKKLDTSMVKLQLDTGRTHQIRVHMSHIGHPLVGDQFYGGQTSLLQYQALHAISLSLTHPFTKEVLTVEAPLPSHFESLVNIT
ncbi:RluA family pseudouridine synthase [Bacillus sp. AK128]